VVAATSGRVDAGSAVRREQVVPAQGPAADEGRARRVTGPAEQAVVDAEVGGASGDRAERPFGGEREEQSQVVGAQGVQCAAHRPRADDFPAVEGLADVVPRRSGSADPDRPEHLAEVLPLHRQHPLDDLGGAQPGRRDALRREPRRAEPRRAGGHATAAVTASACCSR
jgi:hypothetical protein